MTLQTLADEFGVSRATVSNAFGRPDQLSAELRRRILERAVELGFAGPDPVGRGLRRGRLGAVGVLVDEGLSYAFADPAIATVLDGLARSLQAGGFGLLLHAGVGDRAHVELVRRAAVDAWVVASIPSVNPAVEAVLGQGRPVVVLDQPVLPDVPLVSLDNTGGTTLAATHVLGLGHRRLGVLTMPLLADGYQGRADVRRQARATAAVPSARLAGVRRAVERIGLAWDDVPVVECAHNDADAGALGTWELLEREHPPTAVVCGSDQLALGALRAARELGVPVPGELSVVGFDDVPPAATAEPPLTTVAQPLHARGQALGALVRALVEGDEALAVPTFGVELVVRSSTGPVGDRGRADVIASGRDAPSDRPAPSERLATTELPRGPVW